MHLPDEFLDVPTTVGTGAVAAAAVATAVQRGRGELAARASAARDAAEARSAVRDTVLLAAATTGAVFAVQMLDYPVAAGVSGHLVGGALAATLLGPALGMLSITAVLVVQAVLFADGGLTALGPNLLLMAVVGTLVGWGVARAAQGVLGRRAGERGVALAAAAGALVAVPGTAAVFAGLFAVGGTVAVPLGALFGQMLAVHALIGLGEAAITAGVVALVQAVAPRSVALAVAARPVRPSVAGEVPAGVRPATVLLGALAAVAAVAISPFAASAPDGLEATALSLGFAGAGRGHALAASPLASYGADAGVFVGVAGVVGVAVCALLVGLVLRGVPEPVLRRP